MANTINRLRSHVLYFQRLEKCFCYTRIAGSFQIFVLSTSIVLFSSRLPYFICLAIYTIQIVYYFSWVNLWRQMSPCQPDKFFFCRCLISSGDDILVDVTLLCNSFKGPHACARLPWFFLFVMNFICNKYRELPLFRSSLYLC